MRASFLATKERLGDENFPRFLARHAIGARAMPLLESGGRARGRGQGTEPAKVN